MQNQNYWWKKTAPFPYCFLSNGDITQSDALIFLNNLKDECADIIFLDPPFNLGKKYGGKNSNDDMLEDTEYFSYLTKVIKRCIKVLKPGGALFIYHLPKWALRISNVIYGKLDFRHWIAISMKNGFVRGKSLYPAHYALLYYTKGTPSSFSRPKIPALRCRHCNEYVRDYGGYKEFIKNGINLSDIWDDISPVRHKKYKYRSANELPIEILNRVIQISGVKDGLIVDPYAGTGATAIAATTMNMHFALSDRLIVNCKIIKKRIQNFCKERG